MADIIIDSAPESHKRYLRMGDAHKKEKGFNGKIDSDSEAKTAAEEFCKERADECPTFLTYLEKAGFNQSRARAAYFARLNKQFASSLAKARNNIPAWKEQSIFVSWMTLNISIANNVISISRTDKNNQLFKLKLNLFSGEIADLSDNSRLWPPGSQDQYAHENKYFQKLYLIYKSFDELTLDAYPPTGIQKKAGRVKLNLANIIDQLMVRFKQPEVSAVSIPLRDLSGHPWKGMNMPAVSGDSMTLSGDGLEPGITIPTGRLNVDGLNSLKFKVEGIACSRYSDPCKNLRIELYDYKDQDGRPSAGIQLTGIDHLATEGYSVPLLNDRGGRIKNLAKIQFIFDPSAKISGIIFKNIRLEK